MYHRYGSDSQRHTILDQQKLVCYHMVENYFIDLVEYS